MRQTGIYAYGIAQSVRWAYLDSTSKTERCYCIELDVRVDGVDIEDVDQLHLDLINFSPNKQTELKRESERDPILNGLSYLQRLARNNKRVANRF